MPSIESVPKERPTPTLHLHNHAQPLPRPTAYRNPSYYLFQPSHAAPYARSTRSPAPSRGSKRSKKSKNVYTDDGEEEDDGIPKHKKEFERFHSENGVRTVLGSIGPVQNGTHYFQWFNITLCQWETVFSSDAAESGVSTRLHFAQVCNQARLHPCRRCARELWIRRPG